MQKKMTIWDFKWVIAWTLILLILSSTPGIQLPNVGFFEPDKLAHFVVYGIYVLLFFIVFTKANRDNWTTRIGAAIWCSFYGFLMEIMQYLFFPGRYFEIPDNVANISGVLCCLIIFSIFKNKFSN